MLARRSGDTGTVTGHGRTLIDPDADRRLRRDGFAKVRVVDPSAVAELREEFGRLHGWSGVGFMADFMLPGSDVHRAADALIRDALEEPVTRLFRGYQPFVRSFLWKHPGVQGEKHLHQDWMYVDEHAGHHTYLTWVALEDIDGDNGQLRVLRGSHRIDRMVRGSDIDAPWLRHERVIRTRLLSVPVLAGEAVVIDNALVHCSYPNHSDRPRIVAGLGLRHATAPLVHFHRRDRRTAARYDIDEEFFFRETPQDLVEHPPALPVAEIRPIGERDLGAGALASRLDRGRVARLDQVRRTRRMVQARLMTAGEHGATRGRQLASSVDRLRSGGPR